MSINTLNRQGKWNRPGRLISIFAMIVAMSLLFGAAAGAADQAEDYVLEETTVTATKTGETDLQVTPISMTAFSEEMLKNSHAYKLAELTQFIPNAQIDIDGPVMVGYIRGIGSSETFVGGEPNVGFYIDGVYLDKGLGARPDFVDVERIEVLRGPQGTLYGRNSSGGALNIITKGPTDELSMEVGVELGNYSKRRFDFSISGPLVKDKVKARLTLSDSEHDGYVDDLGPGPDLLDEDYTGVRGQIEFTPTDKVDIRISADYMKSDAHTAPMKLLTTTGLLGNVFGPIFGIPADMLVFDDHWTTAHNKLNEEDVENFGVSGTVNIELGNDISLRSITAYRKLDYSWLVDIDGTLVDLLASDGSEHIEQFSQELQLYATWDRWKWVAGFYYYNVENSFPDFQVLNGLTPAGPGQKLFVVATNQTDAYALFGNVTYAFTDKLSLEVGARYSYEEKEVDFTESWLIFFGPPNRTVSDEDDWDDFSPKFGINYQLTDDAFLFANVSKGFRSGTFAALNPSGTDYRLDQEEVWSYEAGLKTDWFSNRMRVNLAAFYMDYTDLQNESQVGPFVLLTNASKAEIKGFELEMTAMPVRGLTINSSLSYLDAEYADTLIIEDSDGALVDANGNKLPRAPEMKFILGAQYVMPVGEFGFLTLRGDLSWTDDYYFNQHNDQVQEAFTVVNALV
ncbi:MAG: TonB-dependent receptor, partial [Deltaproteobacteria bacterium]|nr:TonB-dependent receptor [Deltaproteobacteria bacterium]